MRPLRIFLIDTDLSLILTPHAEGPLGMKILARKGPSGTEITIGIRATPFRVQQGLQIAPNVGTRNGALTIRLNRSLDVEHIAQLNEKIHKFYKVIQYLGLAICAAVSLLLGRKIQPYYGAHLSLRAALLQLHLHPHRSSDLFASPRCARDAHSRHIPLDRPLASDRIWP